jgi:hypothetical protein
LTERDPQRLGQSFVEIARHLAELHQRALHLTQFVGDVLSGDHFATAVEVGAAR